MKYSIVYFLIILFLLGCNHDDDKRKAASEISEYATSPPMVHQGVVYFGTSRHQSNQVIGGLHAVNSNTGVRIWKQSVSYPGSRPPKILGDSLYFAVRSNLEQFDRNSGQFKSNVGLSGEILLFDDDSVYYKSSSQKISKMTLDSLENQWTFEYKGSIFQRPIASSNDIYITSSSLEDLTGYFYKLDKTTGKEKWQFTIENTFRAISIKNNLYVGTDIGHIYILEKNTGNPIQEYKVEGRIHVIEKIDDSLYVGACDNGCFLYALTATGEVLWQTMVGREIESFLQIDQYFYVTSVSVWSVDNPIRTLYKIALEDGSLVWERVLGGACLNSEGLSHSGNTIFLLACNVYALDADTGAFKWTLTEDVLKL